MTVLPAADRHNPHAVGRGSKVALTLPDQEIHSRVLALLAGRGYVLIDNCPSQLLAHLLPESAEAQAKACGAPTPECRAARSKAVCGGFGRRLAISLRADG